jgi:hypothetical protein
VIVVRTAKTPGFLELAAFARGVASSVLAAMHETAPGRDEMPGFPEVAGTR